MKIHSTLVPAWRRRFTGVCAAVALAVAVSPGPAAAHEGHAALPSTGAKVEGDLLLLSPDAEKAIGLKTAKITLGDLERVLRVNARVELPWHQQALVTTLAPGRVERVLVKPGETVAAGQELARIESLELETLQLEMLQAAAEAELAERTAEQRRGLAQKGAIAGHSLLKAETELRQARARLNVSLRKLRALGLAEPVLDRVRATAEPVRSISVTSPISGVVLHADVRVGEFVETTHHLFNIVDRSQVQIVGEVLETNVSEVRPGQSVEVSFAALPSAPITGEIDRVELKLDEMQRTIGAVVPAENLDGRLRPGMFGRMTIQIGSAKQAVLCPTEALIAVGERTFVLLRRGDGKFERKPVQIGLRSPDQVEIVQGLFPGHHVIVVGTQLLGAMFHTEREGSASTPAPGRTRLARTDSSGSSAADDPSQQITAAQAVVEIPIERKAFTAAAIEGRIATIHVHPGQTVRAGQVLAELDSQELRTIQLDLLQAQEKLRWTGESLARIEPLAQQGAVSKSALWQQQTEQRVLSQQVESLVGKLELVGLSAAEIDGLRQTRLTATDAEEPVLLTVPIRAPLDGRIADFDIVPGQVVRPNDPLFEIQNLGTVWIKGYIAERDMSRVQIGQGAVVTFPAYPDLQLTGPVARVAPTLHPGARVLPVWIEVENPDGKLRAGLFAKVEIVPPQSPGNVAARVSRQ